MNRPEFARYGLIRVVVLAVAFFAAAPSFAADTPPRDCQIETYYQDKREQYSAECYYDDSGALKYWIFYIRPSPPDPCVSARNWNDCVRIRELRAQGYETAFIRSMGYREDSEPNPEPPLPPHALAITGFPKIWETQKSYRGGDHPIFKPRPGFAYVGEEIERKWREKQNEIETTWQNQEHNRRSRRILDNVNLPIPKLLPNRTSPFLPVFHRPSDVEGDPPRSPDMNQFCSNNPGARSCKDYIPTERIIEVACGTWPGCDFVDPTVRQWEYRRCLEISTPGCEIHLRTTPSLEDVLQSQFQPWIIRRSSEYSAFPPVRVDYYPGALNLETLRLPLYKASGSLLLFWNQFWQDCWASTPQDKSFDGCKAELRDYVLGSALAKASAKTYPSQRLASKARAITRAIDAANRFHEATADLVPRMHPEKWQGTGIEFNHLEPDDVPSEIGTKIQAAERDLSDAMRNLNSFWPEYN